MICKITSENTKKGDFQPIPSSSKSVSNCKIPNLLKSRRKKAKCDAAEAKLRKIDLEIVVASDEFFEVLPKVRKKAHSKNRARGKFKKIEDTS